MKRLIFISLYSLVTISVLAQQTAKPSQDKTNTKPTAAVPDGNVKGWNVQIKYLDSKRTHCIAKVEGGVDANLITTHDPKWSVLYNNKTPWVSNQWITIIDDQGGSWQSKLHARTSKGKHLLWLENKHNNETNGKDGQIDILDWSGKKWRIVSVAVIQNVVVFNLTPIR